MITTTSWESREEDCKSYVVTPDVSMLTIWDLDTRVFKLFKCLRALIYDRK